MIRAVLLATLLLGACASGTGGPPAPPRPSQVVGVGAADAAVLAPDLAGFVAARRTAAATTLALVPPQVGTPDPLTPALSDALAGLGFAVADAGAQAVAGAEVLRYEVGPLDGGLLVRLELGGAVAGRWYARSRRGALSAGSPFTVREAPPE